MSEVNTVGRKIQQIRENEDMSVEELADASKTSVEMIENIEKGALVPSLTPLLQIARALGVRLGTFLDDAPQNAPVVVKNGTSDKVIRFSGNCDKCENSTLDFFSLASNKADRNMEAFIIDVYPPKTDEINASSHEGEEFIYVLKGDIEIIYGKEKYILSTGDSIYYDSVVSHHLHAVGEDAQILAVLHTPF
ncbi:cupin domain-containing protein [Methanolobus sp. ZRKC3]|uniref:helix-turn-helix domain-containing protein n=1 Tax=Methanolobus sp. ZRKC3 TaxID=3125786 RepID=UPI00324FC4D9